VADWASALLIAGLLTAVLCGYGAWRSWGGMDIEETCGLVHGQRFDEDYWVEHQSSSFPYSNACSRSFDLVPGWVNPAIGLGSAALLVCVLGTAVSAGAELRTWGRRRAVRAAGGRRRGAD